MARPLRVWLSDGWHPVVHRGDRGEYLFRADDGWCRFLGCLHSVFFQFSCNPVARIL